MKEWLTRIWRFTYPVVAFIGGVAALISFFFGDLGEILDRLEPYRIPIIGLAVVLVSVVCIFWVAWLFVREVWLVIRIQIQRQRDIRQFRALAVSISHARQLVEERLVYARSSPDEFAVYLERLAAGCAPLRDELIDLSVLPPGFDTDGMNRRGLYFWATYLDMLTPLAVKGDIDEARMILARLEEQDRSNVKGTPVMSNLWEAIRAVWQSWTERRDSDS